MSAINNANKSFDSIFIVILVFIICFIGIIFCISLILDMAQPSQSHKIENAISNIQRSEFINQLDKINSAATLDKKSVSDLLTNNKETLTQLGINVDKYQHIEGKYEISKEQEDAYLRMQLQDLKQNYILKELTETDLKNKSLIYKTGFYICSLIIWILGIILKKIIDYFADNFIMFHLKKFIPEKIKRK